MDNCIKNNVSERDLISRAPGSKPSAARKRWPFQTDRPDGKPRQKEWPHFHYASSLTSKKSKGSRALGCCGIFPPQKSKMKVINDHSATVLNDINVLASVHAIIVMLDSKR